MNRDCTQINTVHNYFVSSTSGNRPFVSIEFQVEVKPKYVLVNCQGTFESNALLELWKDIFVAAAGKDHRVVLVDIRDLTGTPPDTMQRYDHGVRVAELQGSLRGSLALAVVGNEPIVDPDRFAEVVGTNRGAVARVFTDFDEAVDWIDEMTSRAMWKI